MTDLFTRIAVAALLAGVVACGDGREAPLPADAPLDAGPADTPDATPIVDLDRDGHAAETDCDDNDPAVWQQLPYSFRDADNDDHTVAATGTVCSGASLPRGYALIAGPPDCDDADASAHTLITAFADDDGDGFGDGIATVFCGPGTPPPGYATVDGDCAPVDGTRWAELDYQFRDADLDGHTVAATGTLCSGASLPPGYATVAGPPDCDDADGNAHTLVTAFADDDGDGFGDGMAVVFCNLGAPPGGYAAVAGDCAPVDATRWTELGYQFRDADGDGAAVAETGAVCSGAALPPGYFVVAPPGRPLDCDDTSAAVFQPLTVFADTDNDGFGAGPGQLACTNGSPPPGFAATGTDCDDGDEAAWMSLMYVAVDFDRDGATRPEPGTRCTGGALLPPYFAAAHGNDCDDTNENVSIELTVFADDDHDGFGAGPGQLACTNGSAPDGFSTAGTDCDDDDETVWAELAYHAMDQDHDGVTVPASGELCTNGTLPAPFLATANGNDCDDDDPLITHFAVLYPDHDGDGVGAPPRQITCIGTSIPLGLSRGGYDDDDGDPAVIESDDEDELLELLLLES